MKHGDIEDVDLTKLGAFIRDMTGIGILLPDDGLEDYIRMVAHLPERTRDTRIIDQVRQNQQDRNQPPKARTAARSGSEEEPEEIPDDEAKAARRRLGRPDE